MQTPKRLLQERKITEVLLRMHFRIENDGFKYLRESLEISLASKRRLTLTEVCRRVAIRENVHPDKVKTSLRHAVEYCYGLKESINALFGQEVVCDCLTVKSTLAYLSEYLRLYGDCR